MYSGPKIKLEGLVFGYDTGQNPSSDFNHKDKKRRHFRGEPTINLWDSIDNTQSLRGFRTQHYWNGKRWIVNSTYTDPGVRGPKNIYLGKVFKFTSGALNSTWSGNSYGYMLRDIATTSGQIYTLTCWVYTSKDCDITAIPAVIEGESGGESTVSGYDAQYNLNNKGTWQRIAKKATADTNVRFIPVYPRKNGVTNGSFSGFFMWAAPQVVLGDRPKPYVQTGSSRSSTNSLIDLKKSKTINLSSVSFNTDGLPIFDGTDDYVHIGSDTTFKTTGGWTVESIVYYNSVAGGYNNTTSPANFIGADSITYNSWYWSVLNNKLALWNRSPGTWRYGSTTLQANTWYHTALVSYDSGTSYQMYLNGVAEGGDHTTYTWNSSYAGLKVKYIGRGNSSNPRLVNGSIPVTKIYDRALTPQEIKQNFLAYRRRFNL